MTDDPTIRGLQLHQIERNFPFILKVAWTLDCKMKSEGFERILLCSRDCYLLHRLMEVAFTGYETIYFWTSRLMRYRPNSAYADYAKSLITPKTLIVDMCGTGNSLKHFCNRFGGTPLLVVGSGDVVPCLVRGGIRETSNPAPHSSVDQWPPKADTKFIDRKIEAMGRAFLDCVAESAASGFPEPAESIEWLLAQLDDPRTACLWEAHLKDSIETYKKLNSGPLPHKVVL